ncbi:DedA family protein [Puerhibacterium puerhi]|uniref:DedA family protein n=1 Tax=Puerhibacterium puerhi TaxID=2692623 RepID=UPI002E284711|nr:DedA family protein [Puerhibacterium puerhi]
MAENLTSQIADWAVSLMEALGAPGAGIAVALENIFPPLPSEVILPLAGFTASQGSLQLVPVLVWTTVGSVVGALALYTLGAVLGRDRLRRLVAKVRFIPLEDVDKAEAWFARHGDKAVLIGRLVPIVRSLVSIPAGVERMRLGRFVLLTLVGSGIWNTVLVGAGYLLGDQWHRIESWVGTFQTVVIVVVVAALAWWVVSLVRRARRRRRDQAATPADAAPAAARRPDVSRPDVSRRAADPGA